MFRVLTVLATTFAVSTASAGMSFVSPDLPGDPTSLDACDASPTTRLVEVVTIDVSSVRRNPDPAANGAHRRYATEFDAVMEDARVRGLSVYEVGAYTENCTTVGSWVEAGVTSELTVSDSAPVAGDGRTSIQGIGQLLETPMHECTIQHHLGLYETVYPQCW